MVSALARGRSSLWLAGPSLALALGAGALAAFHPIWALIGLGLAVLGACVWSRPALAAYLVIGLTPLTVGISRGSTLPLVRPNEALALFVGVVLAVRGVVRQRTGQWAAPRINLVEISIVTMAVANSVVPLLEMAVRQEPITHDDLLYSLVMWKFLGLYAIVRASVTTEQQVRNCLRLSVAAASVVAVIAILQVLGKFGVSSLVNHYFPSQNGETNGKGSSTLGLPAATADLMFLNLALVVGMWTRYRGHRVLLAAAGLLFVIGALAAGEFSSAIGLVVAIIAIAIAARQPRLLTVFVPGLAVAAYVVRPVIGDRLSGFQSASGVPASWTVRLQNLQTYFWPKLFSDWNWVLGVEPAARVPVASQITGYVWIESGYTWLLWGGGIPLLASYLFFVYAVARRGWQAARGRSDAAAIAGIAVFAGIFVITVLMAFDPHLTYRGSADAFFFLLALAAPARGRKGNFLHNGGGTCLRVTRMAMVARGRVAGRSRLGAQSVSRAPPGRFPRGRLARACPPRRPLGASCSSMPGG